MPGAYGSHSRMQGYAFGSFELLVDRRELREGDRPVLLGSRALEVLIVLVERAGTVVPKSEFLARVWPGMVVEEANLRVHVAALRKALRDGVDGKRYIANVPGHGYRFVAHVRPVGEAPTLAPPASRRPIAPARLPAALTPLVGRDAPMASLLDLLPRHRLITVVGPGGIGKTTLALAAARALSGSYAAGVCLVDLALENDPSRVPQAIAAALGLPVLTDTVLPSVVAALRETTTLILLDNCEHVIDAAAEAAETLLRGAPDVHVLATSREPLRATGERLLRLSGLDVPAAGTSPAAVTASPAGRLFLARAVANDDSFALTATSAPLVVEICRRLDGIPLAIELAAATLDVLGLEGLAAHLDDRFAVLTRGRRTALPRHRTLRATLDWSHDLLSEPERAVLRRLALIRSRFDLHAAIEIGAFDGITSAAATEVLSNLVNKSLVGADGTHGASTYRLQEVTRAYAFDRLQESGELDTVARRHAMHFRAELQRLADTPAPPAWLVGCLTENIRGALEWAFSTAGDVDIAVDLAAAAVPLWSRSSLWQESRHWTDRALNALSVHSGDTPSRQVRLTAALALALLHTQGSGPDTNRAWQETLATAHDLGNADYQLRALWGLWIGRPATGRQQEARQHAEAFRRLAAEAGRSADVLVGQGLIGKTLLVCGDLPAARRHLERVGRVYVRRQDDLERFQSDQQLSVRSFLAPALWLLGRPDRAALLARAVADEAVKLGHPVSLLYALIHAACPVPLLRGDREAAGHALELLESLCALHRDWRVWLNYYRGWQAIDAGSADLGLTLLQEALTSRPDTAFSFYLSPMLGLLTKGFTASGDVEAALTTVSRALQVARQKHERWWMPELLRLRAEALAARGDTRSRQRARRELRRAIELARQQSAAAWELRAAVSLSRLSDQRSGDAARAALAAALGRVSEGDETHDVQQARRLLSAGARSEVGRFPGRKPSSQPVTQ